VARCFQCVFIRPDPRVAQLRNEYGTAAGDKPESAERNDAEDEGGREMNDETEKELKKEHTKGGDGGQGECWKRRGRKRARTRERGSKDKDPEFQKRQQSETKCVIFPFENIVANHGPVI
jgi:hypothetical protein